MPARTPPASAMPRRTLLLSIIGAAAGGTAWLTPPAAAGAATVVPAPALDATAADGLATAVLAGGCFWGVQGVFQHVQGVGMAVSGYAGGSAETASYRAIGSGRTGHAEAVRISFDPKLISYGRLLQIYFSVAHDPTELNRQGPDHGTQYRSTIFAVNDEQARIARAYIGQLDAANTFGRRLATTIEPLKAFYPAEAYHQDYMTLNPRQPYIVAHDLPKVEQLKRLFPERYRATPMLVGKALR